MNDKIGSLKHRSPAPHVIDSKKYGECVDIVMSLSAKMQDRVGMGRQDAIAAKQMSELSADELVSASLDGCDVEE